jgi:hypothetical protein
MILLDVHAIDFELHNHNQDHLMGHTRSSMKIKIIGNSLEKSYGKKNTTIEAQSCEILTDS